jgi:hypothetical protein
LVQCFFGSIFDVAKVAIIQQEIVPSFGYKLNMKVEKKKNPAIFLATYWNLS